MNATGLGVFYGMAAGALWGTIFLAPQLVAGFTPLQLSAARYLIYGIISLAIIAPRLRRIASDFGLPEWAALVWLSLAGNIVYYICIVTAVQMSGVAFTSIIIGFLPVMVTLVGNRDHGAVPLRRLIPSLLLGSIGIVGISWQALSGQQAAFEPWRQIIGLLAALGALAGWTAYAVGNARWLSRLKLSADDWNMMTGVVTGALALGLAVPAFAWQANSHAAEDWARFLLVAAAVALLASIFGNAFWNRMSRLLSLTMIGQMIMFEILFALLYGFLWERRGPTPVEIAAIISVTASVLLCLRAHWPEAAPKP